MELKNEFRVGVPVAQAWDVLTDIERIAPCMPGAELYEIEDEEYHGSVKVKVGPITAQYRGKAFFLERDDDAYKAVLRAEGRDNRGQGNANATITAQLTSEGDATRVEVLTDLAITGKVAQFGRGVLADVSVKLLNQFVECLESDVLAGVSVAAAPGTTAAPEAVAPSAPAVSAPPPVELERHATEPEPEPEVAVEVEPEPEPALAAVAGNGAAEKTEPKELAPAAPVRKVAAKPAEPVDLFGTAGVPVAKRVLPAVAAAVVVVVLVRRWRQKH